MLWTKRLLGAWAAGLYVVLGALVTVLTPMAAEEVLPQDGSCTLSASQTNTIQGAMTGANVSCHNITSGGIIVN